MCEVKTLAKIVTAAIVAASFSTVMRAVFSKKPFLDPKEGH